MTTPQPTLLFGDCIASMRKLPDCSVDAIVTDPLYGMKYRSAWRTDKFDAIAGDEDVDIYEACLPELNRLLKPNSHLYIFCSWHHVDTFLTATKRYFTVKNLLVWNKNNHGSGDLKGAYAPKHELCIFAHKGRRELKRRIPDVIDCSKVPGTKMVHPTEKPVELMRQLVANSADAGQVVLDPFMGSGTTGVAAILEGCRFIGCERDLEYFSTAWLRVELAVAQANRAC